MTWLSSFGSSLQPAAQSSGSAVSSAFTQLTFLLLGTASMAQELLFFGQGYQNQEGLWRKLSSLNHSKLVWNPRGCPAYQPSFLQDCKGCPAYQDRTEAILFCSPPIIIIQRDVPFQVKVKQKPEFLQGLQGKLLSWSATCAA